MSSVRNLQMSVLLVLLLFVGATTVHCTSLFGGEGGNDLDDFLFVRTPRSADTSFGSKGLCVIGCTPYVDFLDRRSGIAKYRRLVDEMARECDVLVHVGDTKAGSMPCNEEFVTESVHIMRRAAKKQGKLALAAPGDNEISDCHRHGSKEGEPIPSDFYKAADARRFIIDDLKLSSSRDLTMAWPIDTHDMSAQKVPGTNQPYSCEFDKYVELSNYAVATLEVIGSHYYLDDERNTNYPKQDEVDPLAGRLSLFLNANGCTLDWIERSAAEASKSKKRALFFMLHATFYTDGGMKWLGNNGIGAYYSTENLARKTNATLGTPIEYPYKPLFDKLTETAFSYPDIMFYVVHSDGHRYVNLRMNPMIDNQGTDRIYSHHNLMIHQVDGASRALTMYSKFTVDDESFQPVTLKQEWSRAAYDVFPPGHSWDSY